MNWPAYPEYKESAIDWLGKTPNGWDVSRLKFNLSRNDGGVWGDDPDGIADTIVLRSTEQTVDGNWSIVDPARRKLSAGEVRASRLEEGDLLVTKSSGSSLHIGKTTIVDAEVADLQCCYSNFMQRLRTAVSLRPRYAWYLMNHRIMREQFDLYSNSTTGLANLNATILGEARLVLPPVSEQDSILEFLDSETAKIDALVTKQEQLIATLREEGTATITHAVTKGLDPAAEMKDSGVEWQGKFPAHWTIEKGTWIGRPFGSQVVGDADVSDSGDIPFLKVSSLQAEGLCPGPPSWFVNKGFRAEKDFLVFPKRGAAIFGNKVNIVRDRAVLDPNLMGWKLARGNLLEYFAQVLKLIRLEEIADVSTVPQINTKHIASLRLPRPPLAEQQAIVKVIDEQCGKINLLIAKANEMIATLQEYRSALITDAVTGRIDVRGAV
jgi:type I restriction enzyme S subunit